MFILDVIKPAIGGSGGIPELPRGEGVKSGANKPKLEQTADAFKPAVEATTAKPNTKTLAQATQEQLTKLFPGKLSPGASEFLLKKISEA